MVGPREQFGYQPELPGFDKLMIREIDPDDLACQQMRVHDVAIFLEIEDNVEAAANNLFSKYLDQEVADKYVEAAEAYRERGFYIKAAAVKAKAALFYSDLGKHEIAIFELLDAIYLEKLTSRFSTMIAELTGDGNKFIRANYPTLVYPGLYKRGEVGDTLFLTDDIIFRMMNAHYGLAIHISRQMAKDSGPGKAYKNFFRINFDSAYADVEEVNPGMTFAFKGVGWLFSWDEDHLSKNHRVIRYGEM